MRILILIALLVGLTVGAGGQNLVANGDFRVAVGGRPADWAAAGNPQRVEQALDVVTEAGAPAARLRCTRLEGEGSDVHAMLAQMGKVRLERGRLYEFSCRAREEGMKGRAVSVAVSDMTSWQNCGLQQALALGTGWRTFRYTFRATRDVSQSSRLQFWYTEPGTLYLADVRIVEAAAQRSEFTDVVPAGPGRNLVRNGAFELGAAYWSSLGSSVGWGSLAFPHGSVLREGGASFVRIPLGPGRTPALAFDYLKPVSVPQRRPLLASVGWMPVEPGATYTVSCRMRASAGDTPAYVGVMQQDPSEGGPLQTGARVTVGPEWRRQAFTFRPSKRYAFVTVGPDVPDDRALTVDVADVQLERGDQPTAYEPHAAVELALVPQHPGGVFAAGQPAVLSVRVANHDRAPVRARVSFQVTDYAGRAVALAPADLTVSAGAVAEHALALPASWRGYYRVKAKCQAGSIAAAADARVAIVPARAGSDSPLGLNHAFPDSRLIPLAAKAGVTWYRTWSLRWDELEPAQGQYHWQDADAEVGRIPRDVNVMALLPPFPSAEWASEAPAELRKPGYPGERVRQAWAPRDPEQLGAFVERTAARYAARIHVWEFLNEPIYTDYSLPRSGNPDQPGAHYGVDDYMRLLRVAAAAMRKGDPRARVMGGVAGGPEHLTTELMDAGILSTVDILNLHIYPGRTAPESLIAPMDRLLAAMDRHGGRKPIWITEFSYYADDDPPRRPFIPGAGNWAEERFLASEKDCGDYTVRFLAIMLGRGVEKVFIHSGASGSVNDPNDECCLFGYGGVPRKVLPAVAVFADTLGAHAKPAGSRQLGEDAYAQAFETGARSVLVVWSAASDGPRLDLPTGARALDAMGMTMAGRTMRLGESPAYVIGRPGQAAAMLAALRPMTNGAR